MGTFNENKAVTTVAKWENNNWRGLYLGTPDAFLFLPSKGSATPAGHNSGSLQGRPALVCRAEMIQCPTSPGFSSPHACWVSDCEWESASLPSFSHYPALARLACAKAWDKCSLFIKPTIRSVLNLTETIRGQWTPFSPKKQNHFRTFAGATWCLTSLRQSKTALTTMQRMHFRTDLRNRRRRRWGSSEEVSESRHQVKLSNVTSNSWWGIENMIFSDMTWIEFRHSEHRHARLNRVMLTRGGRQKQKKKCL